MLPQDLKDYRADQFQMVDEGTAALVVLVLLAGAAILDKLGWLPL